MKYSETLNLYLPDKEDTFNINQINANFKSLDND